MWGGGWRGTPGIIGTWWRGQGLPRRSPRPSVNREVDLLRHRHHRRLGNGKDLVVEPRDGTCAGHCQVWFAPTVAAHGVSADGPWAGAFMRTRANHFAGVKNAAQPSFSRLDDRAVIDFLAAVKPAVIEGPAPQRLLRDRYDVASEDVEPQPEPEQRRLGRRPQSEERLATVRRAAEEECTCDFCSWG